MATGAEGGSAMAHPFGVRCSRCGRTQPPDRVPAVTQWPYCVFCAAPLALHRWVAAPPPGLGPAPRVHRVDAPYLGPPGYGAVHPTWGFPPVARLRVPVPSAGAVGSGRSLRIRFVAAIGLTLSAFVVCLAAAGAEAWRFTLLLRGRTEVLPARLVRASDAAVWLASLAAVVVVVAALAAVAVAMAGCYGAAAHRAGLRPARGAQDIAARFLVPGWNLYGAGQIVIEAMNLVFRPVRGIGRRPPRWLRRAVVWCWGAWVFAGVLATVLVVWGIWPVTPWGGPLGNQVAANLVEAHILLDVVAAIAAFLAAVVLAALRREWFGGRPGRAEKWTVAQPLSTAGNRRRERRGPSGGSGERDSADLGVYAGQHRS